MCSLWRPLILELFQSASIPGSAVSCQQYPVIDSDDITCYVTICKKQRFSKLEENQHKMKRAVTSCIGYITTSFH
ncbi:hypothetical protein F4779DRAFT_596023 [Xylariaceae sp. FL0662B]|nr:hypothetical protein F4779DRAFT_596023 [Xylariaceae sp. FL0662B]